MDSLQAVKGALCMNIAIGADHRGVLAKNEIQRSIGEVVGDKQVRWVDVGCFSDAYCDYPIFAQQVVMAIRNGTADLGVLVCGTGAGMAIAANRFAGIYAALVWTNDLARKAREHDNANILVLPADYITAEQATAMVKVWLAASFEGGRHQNRIDEINAFGGI
jgi:sugar-phosphate isomerases, RpiB/LacA/LacB family